VVATPMEHLDVQANHDWINSKTLIDVYNSIMALEMQFVTN
jgi:hypothetical protein